MTNNIILLFFFLFHLCSAKDWIEENIELTINCKFNQALSILEQRIENDTTDYKSYFYLAATLNSKMTHYENLDFEQEFLAAIENTIRLIKRKKKDNLELSDSTKAQYSFYLGSAYGYRGFFEGRKGNWYSALSDGLTAIDFLEESVESDSSLMQAYLGIGTYDYWSSSKLKFALWLPFIPDNRDRGLPTSYLCTRRGTTPNRSPQRRLTRSTTQSITNPDSVLPCITPWASDIMRTRLIIHKQKEPDT